MASLAWVHSLWVEYLGASAFAWPTADRCSDLVGGGAISPAFGKERGLRLAGLIVLPPFLKCLGAGPEDLYFRKYRT